MARKKSPSKSAVKSGCPVSRADFLESAENLSLSLGGSKAVAEAREFSTGSFGWHYNGKLVIEVAGKPVKIQANCMLIVVGSKEAK